MSKTYSVAKLDSRGWAEIFMRGDLRVGLFVALLGIVKATTALCSLVEFRESYVLFGKARQGSPMRAFKVLYSRSDLVPLAKPSKRVSKSHCTD